MHGKCIPKEKYDFIKIERGHEQEYIDWRFGEYAGNIKFEANVDTFTLRIDYRLIDVLRYDTYVVIQYTDADDIMWCHYTEAEFNARYEVVQ